MRIFVTGATGFIGSALVAELVGAGHSVIGLCRSEAKAAALAGLGANVVLGSIEDEAVLRRSAAGADGVIHLAFNHDFSRYADSCADDRRTIATLASALAGSTRPLIVTSGTVAADSPPGRPALEAHAPLPAAVMPRAATEEAAAEARAAGANVSVMRLGQIHDRRMQGLVTFAIGLYRAKGLCAYVGDGRQRWAAAALHDTARLYRLAVERAEPGAVYHAAAEEGVAVRDIADVLGRRLGLPVASIAPEEAESFFGWLAGFAAHDMPASSAATRARLDWQPTGPGLLADLEQLEA